MSYCRWSTDNFACDLYCYESADGYVTHVAGARYVGKQTLGGKTEPIGLPHDGESYIDSDLEGLLERLLMLRAVGYNFPDYVLDDVRAEIAEAAR